MFGHPTWNTFPLVTPNSRFLNNHTYSRKVTRYGPFSKVVQDMGVAMEVAYFSHREIDKCSINPGQRAYKTIGCRASPCKVGLSDFEDTRKKGMEEGSFHRISVSEGMIPNIESSFLWLANIEVTHNHSQGFRVTRPVRSDKSESFKQIPQGQIRLKMNVDDNKVTASLASEHVCYH